MKKFSIIIASLSLLLLPYAVSALTFDNLGPTLGLGSADLKETVINILQWALGMLALVAVVMIIAAGIIAGTSSDENRADTAKRVIVGALIGLVIVLIAWAIVIFVYGTTVNVTQ
jgi:heme/copper-type cytochrome/quinol oxidase subunit 2